MKTRKRELLDWESHEDHVGAIYKLLGYMVTANINIDGQQTDLICEKFTPGAGKIVLYVECKYTKDEEQNSVSKDMVNLFISNFHSIKQTRGWTAGVMVSNKKFTQYARAAAAPHHDIVLKTIDELYADIFQIHSYLHSSINTYEYSGMFNDYIPLNAIDQKETASEKIAPRDLQAIVNEWLHDGYEAQLCLLGDFGTGKTTFIRHLHYECAKEFLAGKFERMPLFIQLRDYYDVRDAQYVKTFSKISEDLQRRRVARMRD